jgi:hypothetical protein
LVRPVKRHQEKSYEGGIDGVRLESRIELMGGLRYAFHTEAKGPIGAESQIRGRCRQGIGDAAGFTLVEAHFDRHHPARQGLERSLALIVAHDCPKHPTILSDGVAFFHTSHRIPYTLDIDPSSITTSAPVANRSTGVDKCHYIPEIISIIKA